MTRPLVDPRLLVPLEALHRRAAEALEREECVRAFNAIMKAAGVLGTIMAVSVHRDRMRVAEVNDALDAAYTFHNLLVQAFRENCIGRGGGDPLRIPPPFPIHGGGYLNGLR
jgi:hypothetical protein